MKSIFVFIFLAFFTVLQSAPFDTGFITFTQPNGVEFKARKWGDEFNKSFETIDGYGVIQGNGGWYYYAIVGKNGEFTSSEKKVGISSKNNIPLHPKRSADRISYWKNEEKLVNAERIQKYNEYVNNTSGTMNKSYKSNINSIMSTTSIKLGVVLVDFPTQAREDWVKSFYDDMLFSEGTYYGNRPGDLDPIFGSLNDYIIDQTNSKYNVVGKNGQPVIINNVDPNNSNLAEWLELEYEATYYNNLDYQYEFANTIIQEIEAEYGTAELKSYDVIGIIFAGDNTSGYFGATARSAKLSDGTDVYTIRVPEVDQSNVIHIGLIAHEFCHQAFFLGDQYLGDIHPGTHCLMANGLINGPVGASGSCPAPINIGYKVDLDWVIPETITKGTLNKTLSFDIIYKVEIYGETNEFFLLNMYEDEGYYEYTPSQTAAQEDGLSIWHWDRNAFEQDWAEIELASTSNFKFPSNKNGIQSFNDFSSINSKKRDGTLSDVAIDDIDVNIVMQPFSFEVILDVLDPAPQAPQNFQVSFQLDQNPILSWIANTEPDIDGYRVYKKYTTSSGTQTTNVFTTNTNYSDTDFIANFKFGEDLVEYWIVAEDINSNVSSESQHISGDGTSYYQWKKAADETVGNDIKTYELSSNFPNPFNPTTQISYQIPKNGFVNLVVYNSLGQQVTTLVNKIQNSGKYSVRFNAANLPSGIYIYKLQAGEFCSTKKMLLTK